MKKYLFLLLFLFSIKVYALENNIECDNNECNLYYTIDENYSNEYYDIKETIAKNDMSLLENNIYKFNIIINNLSANRFKYIENSFYTNMVYRYNTNEALMYLFDGIPLSKEYMSDEIIDKKLKIIGYSNGIKDLDIYYLDYINKNYNENFTSILDLNKEYIDKIWPSEHDNYFIYESNENLIKLYNNTIFVEEILPNSSQTIYSLNYKYIKDTNINFNISFIKDSNYGKVTVHYIDSLGNYLTNKEVITGLLNEEYEIEEKKFDNYYLVRIDGEAVGNFNSTDNNVYFMYDLIDDTNLVFNEEEVVNTGVNNINPLFYNLMSLIILCILWVRR